MYTSARSHDGHLINISKPTCLLPCSLHELHQYCELSGIEIKTQV